MAGPSRRQIRRPRSPQDSDSDYQPEPLSRPRGKRLQRRRRSPQDSESDYDSATTVPRRCYNLRPRGKSAPPDSDTDYEPPRPPRYAHLKIRRMSAPHVSEEEEEPEDCIFLPPYLPFPSISSERFGDYQLEWDHVPPDIEFNRPDYSNSLPAEDWVIPGE